MDWSLNELPWPVRVIEEGCFNRKIVRVDGFLGLLLPYYRLRHYWRELKGTIKSRLIFTAMVWGLAYVPYNEQASWYHIGRKS